MKERHLVFDVNETLLDMTPLDDVFQDLFGDKSLRQAWFSSMLQWSAISTLSRRYRDFTELAGDCLDALARRRGVELTREKRQSLFDAILTLPPHPEVRDSLELLRTRGFTLVALTNSAQNTVDQQFRHAHLTHLFTHVLSVDGARCFKPHPAAYALAAQALDCNLSATCLIAAHDWDITGAKRAGCAGAFVARDGAEPHPAGEVPDIVGVDLADVAEQLIDSAHE